VTNETETLVSLLEGMLSPTWQRPSDLKIQRMLSQARSAAGTVLCTSELRARARARIKACRRDEEDGADLRKRQAEHGWVSPASRERLYGVRVECETWEAVLRILDGGSP
jgi:hypothetical protein